MWKDEILLIIMILKHITKCIVLSLLHFEPWGS